MTDDIVEPLTIGRSDILHITNIFQASLNLKRCGACLDEFKQMIALIHILQREKITVMFHLPTLCINERELHTTELSTLSPVCTPSETMLRGIAEAGITDA